MKIKMNISTKPSLNEKGKSIFQINIERGINENLISISDDELKITYKGLRDYTASFKDPEEKVRASYFVELILDKQYPKNKIDFEVIVPRRTPEDRADIVVYEDDELKKSYLVVECKKDGITDAEFKQAIEQTFGNANSLRAQYGIVVAGTTKTAFDVAGFKPSEREKNVIADIPVRYGKAPKYRFIKGDSVNDLKSVSREELIRALEKSHDTVWQGGKLAPTTAFDEVAKLLFCKLKDEKDTAKGEIYKFQIGTHETAQEVYDRIDSIYQLAKRDDAEVFKEDIRLDPKIAYNVVEHLQGIVFVKTDLDTKGVAFERFMEDFFRGKMGQFFTPREIIRFCVEMINPTKNDLVLDPASGSGGFLLNTLDEVRRFAEDRYDENEAWQHWHNFAQHNLYGIEINDQIARVCKMNMIIHDDGHTNVISTDSLSNFDDIQSVHKGFMKDHFDIVLTNPPFGAEIKSTEHNYLPNFVLGKEKKNQKTEILFIERCIDFVKPETGRIAIVLPDSIALNKSLQYVRDFIIERTEILAIVSLPDFAFSHFGANVKSSLFFLKRKNDEEISHDYSVFMAEANKIGYTASGKHDEINDLIEIANDYKDFIKNKHIDNNEKIFTMPISDIMGKRLDPKGHSPRFRDLKHKLFDSKTKKISLNKCIKLSQAGNWGIDPKQNVEANEYILCYVLRNTNFDNDFNLDFSDMAVRLIEKNVVEKLKLSQDDILIEKSGGSPYQPVGRVAIIEDLPSDKPVVFSNFLQRVVINRDFINPKYVYAYLRTLYYLDYMEYIQNQTTGIKNLLMDEFNDIKIPMVSDIEQKNFADKLLTGVRSAHSEIKNAYENIAKIRNQLSQSLINLR